MYVLPGFPARISDTRNRFSALSSAVSLNMLEHQYSCRDIIGKCSLYRHCWCDVEGDGGWGGGSNAVFYSNLPITYFQKAKSSYYKREVTILTKLTKIKKTKNTNEIIIFGISEKEHGWRRLIRITNDELGKF